MRDNAKGLDLRGEERRLLGIKASVEGAASVYRQGMAYLQRDQIENSNRTSARSLPVIRKKLTIIFVALHICHL